jgi:hypothetical protein
LACRAPRRIFGSERENITGRKDAENCIIGVSQFIRFKIILL